MILVNDDCYNYLPHINDQSIDLILSDIPYNITKISWDKDINLENDKGIKIINSALFVLFYHIN